MRSNSLLNPLAKAVALALVVLPAAAQEASSPAVTDAESSQSAAQTPSQDATTERPTTLDTVVVSANKRVENVQDVPKSISVVTPEALDKAGVSTLRELGSVVPSISGDTSDDFAAPPIRGIASFSYSIGVQAQTGVVVDDIPQPTYSWLANELSDIERVEVLAGPQSTLSGRNASGGLVNIITRAPQDTFSGEFMLEQTDDRQRRINAFLTGPIAEGLAFSLSAFSNEWDGNLYSTGENRYLGGWDIQGARGKLRWEINERLTATLTAYTMESETTGAGAIAAGPYVYVTPGATYSSSLGLEAGSLQELYGIEPQAYGTTVGSTRHNEWDSRDRGASLRLDYDLAGGSTLSSLSSYSKADMPRTTNFVALPLEDLTLDITDPYAYADYETSYKTQEFRLVSPGDQRFTYLVGAIYTDTDTRQPYQRLGVYRVNWVRTFEMKSAALFARGTYAVTERDALTAGLRYQRDDMGYTWLFLSTTGDTSAVTDYSAGDSQYDFLSGELSWRHDLAEDVNLYLTLSSAESGQVYDLEDNASAQSEAGLQPLDSQKSKNIELGLKGQWLDRRLTANVNLFLTNYENYQIQSAETDDDDPTAAPVIVLHSIGKVQTKGLEFSSRLRATENLTLGLNGAYVRAVIKDYPDAECYARQTAEQGCNADTGLQDNLAGTTMPNTPKFKVSGQANYFVPLESLPFDLELDAFYRWQSKTYFDLYGNPNLYQDAYGVLNLSATLAARNGRYRLTFFVNNALDKNFYTGLSDDESWSAPAYVASYGRDSFRYSGVTLRVNF